MVRRYLVEDNSGQAVVEAAFALPVMLILMMMLVQPAIILYDRMIMQSAAAEGCRLLTTAQSGELEACEAYILRRLGAVPEQDCFHVHDTGCSWVVEMVGDSSASEVTVRISNELELLPLLGAGASALGAADNEGRVRIEVEASSPTQPSWVSGSELGYASAEWVGAWID